MRLLSKCMYLMSNTGQSVTAWRANVQQKHKHTRFQDAASLTSGNNNELLTAAVLMWKKSVSRESAMVAANKS